ncbi:MAG: hypothetical protein JWO38_5366 [Gemmataceae bacterium]|nr:hypothetical protein [Gemmataceae bacterium]
MRVAFISLIPAPWGGSEELWYRAARELRGRGAAVAVGVRPWPAPVRQVEQLRKLGCEVHWHPPAGIAERVLRRAGARPDRRLRWLLRFRPDLVVHSVCWPSANWNVDLFCRRHGLPYARLVQLAAETWWPGPDDLDPLTESYAGAVACYFVSEANRRLLERQLGMALPNARVVSNPYTVRREVSLPWPDESPGLRLACVGRLDPPSKGQDLVLEVLARPHWRDRPVSLDLFGAGPGEPALRRLAALLGLTEPRVRFRGFSQDIEGVWADHHALVLASRMEGSPLVAIEAMLCGRVPVLTAVGGNSELVTDGATGFLAEAPTARHVADVLDRAWARRGEWRAIGAAAAGAVRRLHPADPAAVFADRIAELSGGAAVPRTAPIMGPPT